MNTKGNLSVQTLFYIMMSLLFVAILIFGLGKLNDVSNVISEQERIEIGSQIKEAFEYCDSPLNKGSVRNLEFRNKEFNSICLGNGGNQLLAGSELKNDVLEINSAGDNVILLKVIFDDNGNVANILNYNIIDSFYVGVEGDTCWFDEELDGKLDVKISCE